MKDKNSVSVFTQARATAYSVLQHEQNEYITVPVNPNTLHFKSSEISQRYLKALYCNKADPRKIRQQFRANLISFYVFLTILISVHLSNQFLTHYNQEGDQQTFQLLLAFGLVLITISYLVLFIIVQNLKQRLVCRYWFSAIGIALNLFIVFTDQRVLAGLQAHQYQQNGYHHAIIMVVVLYMLNLVLYDNSFWLWVVLIVSVVANLGFVLILGIASVYSTILENVLIATIGLIIIGDSQIAEYRSKQLFYRRFKQEQENLKQQSTDIENNQIPYSHIQEICNSCIQIHQELNKVKNVILFSETKNVLKDILWKLSGIIHNVAHTMSSSKIFMTFQKTDQESLQFLADFMNIKNQTNKKMKTHNKINSKTTMQLKKISDFFDLNTSDINSLVSHTGSNWNFDIWFLHQLCGQSIVPITTHLFTKWNFTEILQVDFNSYQRYFCQMENSYPKNPYHNACHAGDVLHSLLYFVQKSRIIHQLEPLDIFALIVAAVGHDVCHPGVTNRYLVNSLSPLAVTYNDQSVLQNMHAAKTFQISTYRGSNIFQQLSKEDFTQLRKMVIQMILQTDLSKHFQIMGRFRTRAMSLNDLNYDIVEDKAIILSMGLKVSDVAHSAKSEDLHLKWTQLINKEFLIQGDLELEQNLPVSIFCSREESNLPKNQIGFLKTICYPMFEVWCQFLDSDQVTKTCLKELNDNLEGWRRRMVKRQRNTVKTDQKEQMLFFKHLNSSSI